MAIFGHFEAQISDATIATAVAIGVPQCCYSQNTLSKGQNQLLYQCSIAHYCQPMLCCLLMAFMLHFYSKIGSKLVEKIDFQKFF